MYEHLTSTTVYRWGTRHAFTRWSDGRTLPLLRGGDGDPTPAEQLLADLQAGTIETPEALTERLGALSPNDLAAFEQATVGLFDAIVDGTAEVEDGADRLAVLETLANAIEGARSEGTRREDAAAAEQASIDAIRNRVHTDPENANGDGGAEGEAAGGDGDPGDQATEPAAAAPAATPEPEPVSAAAPPPAPVISRVAVRRPTPQPTRSSGQAARSVITAAADCPGFSAGQEIPGIEALTEALSRRADALAGVTIPEGGAPMKYLVATARATYPEDRDLRTIQRNGMAVEQVITAAIGRNGERLRSLTAAGGFCAPAPPLYDQISISATDRPARNALPSFMAGRGKVMFMPSPLWTDYASGVRVWTSTNDVEALTNSNVRKGCVRVDCDDTQTVEVYAIPVCVTVGNFFDRTYPERRQAILDGVAAWQARFAERALLSKIATGSTTVTTGQTLGTIRDVLAVLDRAIAGFQSRWRVEDGFRLEWFAPRWLRNMMRADLVRALPVSGASITENLAVADGTLAGLLTARGLNVTWLWDGENGGTDQEFGAETGAALQNWPTRVISYLFHPGAHVFLDGGELNIGVQRDSTLNSTNDLQIWGETFEGLMTPGLESLRLDMDVCPSGEVSGSTDVTGSLCVVGS